MIVNRSELAEIFGVAKTTVDSWVSKGCPVIEKTGVKGKPSKYDTVEVHMWLTASNSSEDFPQLIDEERYRKLKRENDIEDNLVAPVSLITAAIEKTGKQIIPILESLPLEMKRYFPELTGDQIQIVKTAIAKCRNSIADMKIDLDEK